MIVWIRIVLLWWSTRVVSSIYRHELQMCNAKTSKPTLLLFLFILHILYKILDVVNISKWSVGVMMGLIGGNPNIDCESWKVQRAKSIMITITKPRGGGGCCRSQPYLPNSQFLSHDFIYPPLKLMKYNTNTKRILKAHSILAAFIPCTATHAWLFCHLQACPPPSTLLTLSLKHTHYSL